MARNYQYETSPRKLEPDYSPRRKKTKVNNQKQIEYAKEKERQNNLKMEKRRHHKNIAMIIGMFLVLLVVSYRSSLITERFNEIQDKKSELAAIEKTNGQLEVGIESSLNLNNVEKEAEKKLGMKRLDNSKKVYVTLPKKDYTESSVESVKTEENLSWIEKIFNKIFNK